MNLDSLPKFISRCVLLGAMLGVGVGILISMNNDDGVGWGILRAGILGALFAVVTKYAVMFVTKLWLESRVEDFEKKFDEIRQQKKVVEPKKKK